MILYTSNKEYGKIAFHALVFSVVVLVFGAIYEHFSYGVYSVYMIYAFAFPLLFEVLPFAVMTRFGSGKKLRPGGIRLYQFGMVTLTVGSLVTGILEIYGTTNSLTRFYWITGGILAVIGFVTAHVPVKD